MQKAAFLCTPPILWLSQSKHHTLSSVSLELHGGAKVPHLWMRTQHHLFSELLSALGLCIIRCPPPKEASLTDVGGALVCEEAYALLQLSLCES